MASTSPVASSSTSDRPRPSKDHLVRSYPPDAFPRGFLVASTHAGIKKAKGGLDLGILVSDRPASAAACMTRNVFKAAPVTVTAENLYTGKGKAMGLIVNSGCANAVTGKKGLEDARTMANEVRRAVSSGETSSSDGDQGMLVMSTGVIGQHLPIDSISSSIPQLASSLSDTPEAWKSLAKAFMTTDTFPKLRTRHFDLNGYTVRIAGIDKGAGMIAPSMGSPQPPHATLLGVIATDAAVEPESLQNALQYAVDRSFNSITVDGDMSTNDTIICLANGAADGAHAGSKGGMEEISESSDPKAYKLFREELKTFAEELAQLVVRDGEGATKFVTVKVKASQLLTLQPLLEAERATVSARTDVRNGKCSGQIRRLVTVGQDCNVWRG